MSKKRKNHSSEFKSKVALATIRMIGQCQSFPNSMGLTVIMN